MRTGLITMLLIAGTSASAGAALLTETQNFDNPASAAAAGWAGNGNNTLGGNNFGYSDNTDFTAGTSGADEAGGTIARTTAFAWYADTTIRRGPNPLQGLTIHDSFTANGELFLGAPSDPDDNLEMVGYFDQDASAIPGARDGGFLFQDRPADNNYGVSARFAQEQSALVSIAPGAYTFEFSYDAGTPTTNGVFTASILSGVTTVLNQTLTLTPAQKASRHAGGFDLDAFGLVAGGRPDNNAARTHVIFIDGLSYTVVPEPAGMALLGIAAFAVLRRRTR